MKPIPMILLGVALSVTSLWANDRDQVLAQMKELSQQTGDNDQRLLALYDHLLAFMLVEHPEYATFMGVPGRQDKWTDNSLAAIAARKAALPVFRSALDSIDRSQLDEANQLNFELLDDSLTEQMAGQAYPDEYFVVTQMSGPQQDLARTIASMPTFNEVQYQDILARLAGIPKVLQQSQVLMKKGLDAGITPPRVTLRDVAAQIDNQIVDDPGKAPLLLPFAKMPDSIASTRRDAMREEAFELYQSRIRPALEAFREFFVDTYLPQTRESIGMMALPKGADWYAFRAKSFTTTALTPDEIHQVGLREVKRIRSEMEDIIAALDFEGDFEAFTTFLRTDPQFYFDTPEDLLQAYRDIAKRADAALLSQFGKLPRLPYGVFPVPAYAEKSQTTAYYQPGSAEMGRPGQFYANTYDLKSRPKWEMEALTLHEAVPGHHLQLALSQELEDVPALRKFGMYTAFIEGWGLYAESLGEDMGFYQDPYAKFGQLTYEMWRAIRLVVDTGIHAKGWSRQQAIDYFKKHTGKSEHDITVEVDRYIVWPGQALAYKIGELKIKDLRAKAEAELGDQFDVRAFHDTLLGSGALPLSVLEVKMNAWVDAQKSVDKKPGVPVP